MRFHVFVANRVADILVTAPASQWRYVATDDNPDDDCGRGLYGSVVTVPIVGLRGLSFSRKTRKFDP